MPTLNPAGFISRVVSKIFYDSKHDSTLALMHWLPQPQAAQSAGAPRKLTGALVNPRLSVEWLICRYQQMGNAVCPMVASALGRCLALAAVGAAPESLEQAVVSVPDPAFVQVKVLHPIAVCM